MTKKVFLLSLCALSVFGAPFPVSHEKCNGQKDIFYFPSNECGRLNRACLSRLDQAGAAINNAGVKYDLNNAFKTCTYELLASVFVVDDAFPINWCNVLTSKKHMEQFQTMHGNNGEYCAQINLSQCPEIAKTGLEFISDKCLAKIPKQKVSFEIFKYIGSKFDLSFLELEGVTQEEFYSLLKEKRIKKLPSKGAEYPALVSALMQFTAEKRNPNYARIPKKYLLAALEEDVDSSLFADLVRDDSDLLASLSPEIQAKVEFNSPAKVEERRLAAEAPAPGLCPGAVRASHATYRQQAAKHWRAPHS